MKKLNKSDLNGMFLAKRQKRNCSKTIKQCISLFLVIAMTFSFAPSVFAEVIEQIGAALNSSHMENDNIYPEGYLYELVSERTEYVKVFLMADGTKQAIVSATPLHTKNEADEWIDIDNTLVEYTDENNNTYYVNVNDKASVKLPSNLSEPVEMSRDGYSIEMELVNVYNNPEIEITDIENIQLNENLNQMMNIPPKTSAVVYDNIFRDIDVHYTLKPGGTLKEDIVLNSRPQYDISYSYRLNADGLAATQLSDGTVYLLNDSHEPMFVLPAPYMQDANGVYCYNIDVLINEDIDGYYITYIPDDDWLQASTTKYPVTIDPIVTVDTEGTVDDLYVSNGTVYNNNTYLYVSNTSQAYIRFNEIPHMDMNISKTTMHMGVQSFAANNEVAVKMVTSDWEPDSFTTPTVNSSVFEVMKSDTALSNEEITADITAIVKRWQYGHDNNGIQLSLSAGNPVYFTSSRYAYSQTLPYLKISYTDGHGLEDYWETHSQNIGRAGTAYVNDYTGYLSIVRNDFNYSGSRMGADISFYYGKQELRRNNSVPFGFTSTYSQLVGYENVGSTAVVRWEDEDGTVHYVYRDPDGTGEYFHEDGTVSEWSGTDVNVIVSRDGYTYTFNRRYHITESGSYLYGLYLSSVENNTTGDIITINGVSSSNRSNENLIGSVIDSVGRRYVYNYNSSNQLTSIDYYGKGTTVLQTVNYSYDNYGNLTQVTYPDGNSVYYTYWTETEGRENWLKTATDVDGYTVRYDYLDCEQPRVSSVTEYNSKTAALNETSSERGGGIELSYSYQQTTITNIEDETNFEIKQFDNFGNTLSSRSSDGYANYNVYGTSHKNQLIKSSDTRYSGINYLYADMSAGTLTNTDGSTAISSATTFAGLYHPNSVSLIKSNTNGTSSLLINTAENLEGFNLYSTGNSEKYVFSAYLKIPSVTVAENKGAYIKIITADHSGNTQEYISEIITEATGDEWVRIEMDELTLLDASVKVYLCASTALTVLVDGIMLEREESYGSYNHLPIINPYQYTAANRNYLYRTDTSGTRYPYSVNYLRVSAQYTLDYSTRTVNINGSKGDTYTYGVWVKALGLPAGTDETADEYYGVKMYYYDSNNSLVEISSATAIPGMTDWQYLTGSFALPEDASKLCFKLFYGGEDGVCLFGSYSVCNESFGTGYVYDDDGNVIEVTDGTTEKAEDSSSETTTEETENETTTTSTSTWEDDDGNTVTETEVTTTYKNGDSSTTVTTVTKNSSGTVLATETSSSSETTDASGNVTSVSTDTDGVTTESKTDKYGNVLYEKTSYGSYTNMTVYTYDDEKDFLTSVIDSLGNAVIYTYNEDLATLTSITDANGNTTNYTYDGCGNLTGLSSSSSSVSYVYSNGRISKITANDGMSYNFAYTKWGLLSRVYLLVNGSYQHNLVSYTYDADGNITNTVYGNGGGWNYTYDDKGNITGIKVSGDTYDRYVFEYDEDGVLVRYLDNSNNTAIIYSEDGGMSIIDNATSETLFSVSYDEDDTVITVGNNTFTTSQTYDEDLETTVTSFTNGSYTFKGYTVTDNFGRIGTSYIKRVSSTGAVTTLSEKQYTYVTNEDGATSERIAGLTYYTSYGSISTSFTYDANGNIATISKNNTVIYSYEYDELNQLIREDDRVGNKTVIYTYDNNGNIQSKKYYALSIGVATADLSAPIDTVNYGYSSSTRDVITSYDGQNITTDYRGNITSWNGKTFVWQGGNQLASITDGGNTYSYTYNSDGLRTSKTVNGVTTKYYWVDNVLTAQVCGNNVMLFRYDADGNPLSFNYNGTEYFYVLNTQGDVSAIMDMSGVTVAFYYYDAWGNITSIVDYNNTAITSTSHIAHINPIRYRGYYYDTEIEMYYLQSRYYSPELCRFISSDEIDFLGASGTAISYNLFSYCVNNPINIADPTGHIAANIVGAAIGVVIGVIGGVFLGNWLADILSFRGWKRGIFVASVTALVGAAAGAIGYFIGPYVAKVAIKLGQYVANLISKGKIAFKKLSSSARSSIKSLLKQTCCFVAGTMVLTEEGHVPIEEICPGDLVWAENPETGEKGLKQVVNTVKKRTDTLVYVLTETEEIVTTQEHPFWVVGKGWVTADAISEGDILTLKDGNTTEVVLTKIEHLTKFVYVYNFEVEDWHTYYVSNSSILVHNIDCATNFTRKSAAQIEKMLNVKSGTFHRTIKPDILKSVEKDILKKVGSNPDILIAKDGTIQLVSTVKKGVSFILKLNIFDFIP